MAGSIPNAHEEHLIMLPRKRECLGVPELPMYRIVRMTADLFLAIFISDSRALEKY